MALSGSASCLRILLVAFNLIVFIAGLACTGFGSYLVYTAKEAGATGAVLGIPIFVLTLGLFVMVIGFLGCCGAWKQNKCFLRLFALLVLIIIIVEIIAAILLLVYKDKIQPYVNEYITKAIKDIEANPAGSKSIIDAITAFQRTFKCCGADAINTWKDKSKYCCMKEVSTCPNLADQYQKGCTKAVTESVKHNMLGFGVALAVLGVIELGAVISAFFLAKRV